MKKKEAKPMGIGFAENIIKHYLRDVYFINGTAYAGKSTAVRNNIERTRTTGEKSPFRKE